MKTDHPTDLFLAAGPEAFRVLTGGCQLDGAYRFSSVTIKGLERRLDGILEPEGHSGPAYVVEFQAQHLASAWYNINPVGAVTKQPHRCEANLSDGAVRPAPHLQAGQGRPVR